MFPLLGGLISGGIGAISSMINTDSNNQNNQLMQQQAIAANQAAVQQQQQFQTQMSNTAYQRASTDMQAAGLNPAMMFGSGSAASSPSGASFTTSPASKTSAAGGIGSALQSGISSAVALKTADATIDNLVAQNAKIKAETLTEEKRPYNVAMDSALKETHGYKADAERHNIEAELPTIVDRGVSAKSRMDLNPSVRSAADKASFLGNAAGNATAPVVNLISSAKGVKSLFNDRFGSW